MKKFSQINEARRKANELDIQQDTINYISVEDLDKYLKVAGKFLSDETKEIINWLKVNNKTYLHDLDPNMDSDNALAAFYSRGIPKDEHLKELYSCIGKVKQADRLLEIPVFLTKEQFENIINKKISPDEILLDLTSEKGRNEIVRQYEPLIHKIIRQWIGKSNLGVDDLLSVALEGMTYAINTFGKRKVRGENGKWVEAEKDEKVASYSFTQYAAYCIDNWIKEEIKHHSHTVRIPASQQKKQRTEQGFNSKNNSISGDTVIKGGSDDNKRSLFDILDTGENGNKNIDSEDLDNLWKKIYKKLEDNFKERDLEIFYSAFGLNGYELIKGKALAKKYDIVESAITAIKKKVIAFIRKDKDLYTAFSEILDIVGEARSQKYKEEDQFLEAHSFKINKNNSDED